MSNIPRLSVLLTFKNQREEAENTLSAVLELDQVEIELVVLDDGSTDGTRDAIHSVLDHYQHENTYFFDHDGTYGRGNLLNEGLRELEGPYLWMPETVEEIDEEHLYRVLKALDKSDKTGLLQRPEMIPETVEEWVDYLDNHPLPRDAFAPQQVRVGRLDDHRRSRERQSSAERCPFGWVA
jgi:glycosyltransferase involved in cell wall biosynthesis